MGDGGENGRGRARVKREGKRGEKERGWGSERGQEEREKAKRGRDREYNGSS